ncbi:MFS transporter [Citrobacter portucalensis]|uniref:MFS transporter n=1 Tax=Citrobacter portucalensis TaxID=1639133 RepID=UPI002542E0CC|nr:MFS transporter [Citrobacter portucalensis]WIJ57195.1 MFS transporter [Citrobacter portucalensis]
MEKIIAYIIPIICGLTAANMYYIQPLVPFAQSALQIGYEQTSMLYSFSLAGNALSLLFLVPLGDFYNKKSIIILLYLTSFVALLVFYFSSYYPFLAICSMFIGIGTSALPLITAVFSKRENGHIIIGRIMGEYYLVFLHPDLLPGFCVKFGDGNQSMHCQR